MKKHLTAVLALLLSINVAYADGDNKAERTKAKVKRDEAIAIAQKEVPGTVLDADLEKRRKQLLWIIDIKPTDGSVPKKEVRIDANSGKVLSVRNDNDRDDNDKND